MMKNDSTFSYFPKVGLLGLWLLISLASHLCSAGMEGGKVRLTDVQVLTLSQDKWTTARRGSAIPQLKCIGGSAGCSKEAMPQVVQCYNKGFDGSDVQWECKAELEHGYKLGRIDVSCEGYDYPDDPYVLKGSCGLQYTLESTSSQGYGSSDHFYSTKATGARSLKFTDILFFVVVGLFIYAVYKTCIAPPTRVGPDGSGSGSSGGYWPGGGGPGSGGGGPGTGGQPPPYGWRPSPGDETYDDASCHNTYARPRQAAAGVGGIGNNFWTGLGAGGLLGYMFGNTGNRGYNNYGGYGGGGGSWFGGNRGYGGGGYTGGGGGGSSRGSSGSTHTSSSYGGTSRR